MTPAERQYDLDLVKSMRNVAQQVEPHSKRIAVTLRMAADRLDALSLATPVTQPASTPDQRSAEPVRNHGKHRRRG